ncbi:protein STICHEL-like [Andrographis paniculata]|uniref:protein STICHEL-like n=1 Tax=Andrographis paniculata TaxID=175694 RepID=UPI0021E71328|nr:protein STICHEL-like [Andrographis paniculata]
MIPAELHGGGMDNGIDPSNLHLKKELTQIRKAARLLKDPGTSSTWRSPIGSARSLAKHHHHYVKTEGNANAIAMASSFSENLNLQEGTNDNFSSISSNVVGDHKACNNNNNPKNSKQRKVYLYNWRRSGHIDDDDADDNGKASGSSSTQDDSLDAAVGNDSKSDSCLSDIYATAISKFTGASLSFTPPSIRHGSGGAAMKKKAKRKTYSSDSPRDYIDKLRLQELLRRYTTKNVAADDSPSLSLSRLSFADRSEGTEDCLNSEDFTRSTTLSPFLARLKNKGWTPTPTPAKLLSRCRKDERSPVLSSSSYKRFIESWDATTGSVNDDDDNDVDDRFESAGRQGCGIPCYWSKRSTPKSRIGSSCSPSLSDTLRRKGSIILCGSQKLYKRRHYRSSPLSSSKKRHCYKAAAQSLVPLLTNGSSVGTGNSDDEVSTNLGELDLEALSRLDRRRLSSSYRSQDGLELVVLNGDALEEGSLENARSLSHKYRPMFFEELIGQNIVVKSLTSAVSRRRIAPVYLFHGPRGTGKTSAARVFAAALNCRASDETKPCGVCGECADFVSGKSSYLGEVDGSNKKGIDIIKYYLKNISMFHSVAVSHYKVFIVEECHLLPSKTWLALLRLLEKPMPRIVFVLITTDVDNVPRAVVSRCQKHLFNKISNDDIANRLWKISSDEKFEVESSALELIASNANGSVREAETMLDQLSLFGKRITKSLVNELIGVVSDDKLLELLELAMSTNAAETVIKARELMDSGVDPIVLMSQMVSLIVDIIAGTHHEGNEDSFFGGRSLTERGVERLKHALTILSQAEKHLGVSSDRSTWFTATLLQLGSLPSVDQMQPLPSLRATEEENGSMSREAMLQNLRANARIESPSKGNPMSLSDAVRVRLNHQSPRKGEEALRCVDSKMLESIWLRCIDKCHSKTLRQLLHSYGKLVSISEIKGEFIAHIAFIDGTVKSRAEGFLSSITNSFETVLQRSVEVKMILLKDAFCSKKIDTAEDRECHQTKSSELAAKDSTSEIPLRRIESIIHEQRLETAWLQAMEKGTPGSMAHLRPERNQILPQDGVDNASRLETVNSRDMPSQHWEDELNREIKALRVNDGSSVQDEQIVKTIDHYPISPSLLHSSNTASNLNLAKDNMGYESGSGGGGGGCGAMFCWRRNRVRKRGRKVCKNRQRPIQQLL